MKKTFIFLNALLGAYAVNAQYAPATQPETTYGPLVASSCVNNDVGTDTRSAGGSAMFGFGSSDYLNFTNVTVNSCHDTGTGAPTFYWENSAGLTGSSPLPVDALDPDVVMVSDPGSNAIWALAVYYMPGAGAYGMSVASFTPGTGFSPMSPPTWTYPYTATATYPGHINIDSDNRGNYGIVFQEGTQIRSFTAGTNASGPLAPTNMRVDINLIEPDIAILGNTALEVNIVGVRPSRNRYRAFTRNFTGTTTYSPYMSPSMASFYEPRIAAPSSGSFNQYAITVQRTYTSGPSTITDIIYDIDETGPNQTNDGSLAALPAINANNPNILPALTYSYTGLGTGERINIGWWVDVLGTGPCIALNQPRTFVNVDLNTAGAVLTSPNCYMDITNANGLNNESTVAVSGRYLDWGKSAAFTYEDPSSPGSGSQMMWKITGTGTGWKPAAVEDLKKTTIGLQPNPASSEVLITTGLTDVDIRYQIYNQLGVLVSHGIIENGEAKISVSNWSEGVYVVKVESNTTQQTTRFVKN